ncbi:MAG: hypothetical protein WC980_09625 [Candidatus Brocadiia bacterium]
MRNLCLKVMVYMTILVSIAVNKVYSDEKIIVLNDEDNHISRTIMATRCYKVYGAGYENAVLARLKLENTTIEMAKFQISIAFPEIRVYSSSTSPFGVILSVKPAYDSFKNELICLPYLDGLENKLKKFIDYIDNKNKSIPQKRLEEILLPIASYPAWVFTRQHTAAFSLKDDIFKDGPEEKKIFDKFHEEVTKAQKDIASIMNDKNTDRDFLAFAIFLRGWFYFKLSEYSNAIEMFDKVTGCGIADYSLPAALYKVISLGLSSKDDRHIAGDYDNFFALHQFFETKPSEFRAGYYKRLPKSLSAKKAATDIQNDYKHLEKDRKVILIWCKQITTGELEPIEQVKDDSKTDAPIKEESKEPKQNTPK